MRVPGRGDQLVEHPGGDRPLVARRGRSSPRRGAAGRSARRRRGSRSVSSRSTRELLPLLLGPEPRHDELEERRLDPRLLRLGVLDDAAAGLAEDDVPGPDVPDHRLDELGLDLVRRVAPSAEQLVVRLDRLDDRGGRGLLVEVLDAEVAGEEVEDPALEAVELRVRVLAERDQEARAQLLAVDRPRELDREGARPVLVGVVDEVLLELVEDDEQLGADRLVEVRASGRRAPAPARRAGGSTRRAGRRGAASARRRLGRERRRGSRGRTLATQSARPVSGSSRQPVKTTTIDCG